MNNSIDLSPYHQFSEKVVSLTFHTYLAVLPKHLLSLNYWLIMRVIVQFLSLSIFIIHSFPSYSMIVVSGLVRFGQLVTYSIICMN